jgi:hypothetical protein
MSTVQLADTRRSNTETTWIICMTATFITKPPQATSKNTASTLPHPILTVAPAGTHAAATAPTTCTGPVADTQPCLTAITSITWSMAICTIPTKATATTTAKSPSFKASRSPLAIHANNRAHRKLTSKNDSGSLPRDCKLLGRRARFRSRVADNARIAVRIRHSTS